MPYLNLQTNTQIPNGDKTALLKRISKLVADVLNKPEQYVMVAIKDQVPMLFNGTDEPLVFLEIDSIGLKANDTKQFAQQFCSFVSAELNIPSNRIYVKFFDVQRSMWGWNGDTFE